MSRHGENIRKRSDGRWEARIVYRSLSDGKKIVKSFYGSTYAEAKTRRKVFADCLNTDESGTPVLRFYPLFRDVASAWIDAKARSVKRSTLSVYLRELNIYLLPEFGDWTIDRLDGDCINDFLTNLLQNGRKALTAEAPVMNANDPSPTADQENGEALEAKSLETESSGNTRADTRFTDIGNSGNASTTENSETASATENSETASTTENSETASATENSETARTAGKPEDTGNTGNSGLSAKTVSNVKLVLLSILKYARSRHMIGSVPECMTLSNVIPKIEVLTKAEQRVLEELLFSLDKPICLISILSLYTGIRIGEACGLQWRDVDLINGTISITKTVIRITNVDEAQVGRTKVVIQSPKTQSSIRVIPIPDRIMSYLHQKKAEEHIYLASGKETFTEPRRCQYQFRQLLKQAEIPHYKFHVLRHTFATRCVEQGVDVKSLSEILGHSSVTITMQRYVHPSLEMKRTQINKLTQS